MGFADTISELTNTALREVNPDLFPTMPALPSKPSKGQSKGQPSIHVSERDLCQTLEAYLILKGWRFYHVYEQHQFARRTTKGFPDYHCFKVPHQVAIEVKSEKGKLTKEQLEWQNIFKLCGIPYFVLRLSTWDSVISELEKLK